MIVDTSAVVAILLKEPEREELLRKMAHARYRQLSAVSYMEAGMVLTAHFGEVAEAALDNFLRQARIESVPVTNAHAKGALHAFRQYGKGRHKAGLNFGDCYSYALAKSVGEPLLFKGTDFGRTDVDVA